MPKPTYDQKLVNRAIDVKHRYEQDLMQRPGVTGVGVGMRLRHGRFTDEVAIVVTVNKKYTPDELNEDDLLPTEIEGIPVDVQQTGQITPEV